MNPPYQRSDRNAHQRFFRAEADLRAEARASGAAPSIAVEHLKRIERSDRKMECRRPRSRLHVTPDWERDFSLDSGHLPQKSVERSQLKFMILPLNLLYCLVQQLGGVCFHGPGFFRAGCVFIMVSVLVVQEVDQVFQFLI